MLGRTYKSLLTLTIAGLLLPFLLHAQVLVNINTATADQLTTLTGIGPAKAQAIIDYRNAHGPFQSIEDITKVSGIPLGGTTYEGIKDDITVEDSASQTEESETDASPQSQEDSAGNSSVSSHYSSIPLTDVKPQAALSVGAGRDRVGVVGSPLEFKVETKGEVEDRRNDFIWNFGDGTEGDGYMLSHTYEYPGDYIVVLNAHLPEGDAVARVNVKIVSPDISITYAGPERVELTNSSKYEVNLFGRGLVGDGKIFAFPKDTIIKAGAKISFGAKATGLVPLGGESVQLMVIGTEVKSQEVIAEAEEQKTEKIAFLQNQILELEQTLASLSREDKPEPIAEEAALPLAAEPEIAPEPPLNTASAQEAVHSSWLQTVKQFLLKTDQ
jgi:competence protein ComEA